jgi:hypothetical protein
MALTIVIVASSTKSDVRTLSSAARNSNIRDMPAKMRTVTMIQVMAYRPAHCQWTRMMRCSSGDRLRGDGRGKSFDHQHWTWR